MKKPLMITILLFAGVFSVLAQPFEVKGVVLDSNGQTVISAAVIEEGTSNGTVTDLDGTFQLKVKSPESLLKVSCLGMNDVIVSINGRTDIEIQMEFDHLVIENSVVTALGIKRNARALGYAVASLDADAITAGREANAVLALSGKIAGVDISSTAGGPTGSTNVTIRGNSQLSGTNRPLYVIDGIPVDNTQFDALSGTSQYVEGYDYGDVLSSIDPNDIENISVLKGASAAALYGSQASNGVIIITTKSKGNKKGWSVELDSSISVVTLSRQYDDYQRVYGTGTEGRPLSDPVQAQNRMTSAWGGKLDASFDAPIFNGKYKPYSNVADNINSFYRTGTTFNNTIAIANTQDKTSFRFSVSDVRSRDIIPNANMSRTNMSLKATTMLGKRFSMDARATYIVETVNNRPALANSTNNVAKSLIGLAPNIDQEWLSDGYKSPEGYYVSWTNNQNRLNPYWIMNEMSNVTQKNRLVANVKAQLDIIDGLKLIGKAGTDYYNFDISEYVSRYTPNQESGAMKKQTNRVYRNTFEAMLKYDKKFKYLDLSAFVGASLDQSFLEMVQNSNSGQVIPGWSDITNYSTYTMGHSLVRKEVRSFFAMLSLGYKDYAYLEATLRNDVSSALAKNYRSYWYPSVSGSVLLSNIFKMDNDKVSLLKLRASWAEVGGDTAPYKLDLAYALNNFSLGGVSMGKLSSTTVPYAGLKPTRTYSWEWGVDLRFFDSRLNLDFTYYNTKTRDQIISLPVSMTTGYKYAMVNAGEISNAGIEMQLIAVPIRTKDFSWETTLSFSHNKNKVRKLHRDVTNYELARAALTDTYIVAMEGEAYGAIVGKKFARTTDGKIILNESGLPTYDTELSVLGNGNYDFGLGWGHTFQWKSFSASLLFDMKFGAEIYSQSATLAAYHGTSERTLAGREEWYKSEEQRISKNISPLAWKPTGGYLADGVIQSGIDADGNPIYKENDVYVSPETYWQNVYASTPEPFIYDASYIKLRELSFSYTFGKKYFKNFPITSISLSAFGRNLWLLWTRIPNIDPESSYNSNKLGIEYCSLPARRNFGFGLNIKF